MTAWTSDELDKIATAEELQIASLRRDGTLRNPVTIWVVRHGDDLYVRSYRRARLCWFRAAQDRHEGHIRAGGVEKDVTFVEADPGINDQIDTVYRSKYRRYGARFVTRWWPRRHEPRRSNSCRAQQPLSSITTKEGLWRLPSPSRVHAEREGFSTLIEGR